jgi:hypothetical protein
MTYQVSTTAGPSGKFECYDLDLLPHIDGRTPRELAQEGKLSPHQLYALLRERNIPGIAVSMGMQDLLLCWARELKRQAEISQENIVIGKTLNQDSPPAIVPKNQLLGAK